MRVPGALWTVLIAAATAFLQSLASGLGGLDVWWAALAVALVGFVLKLIDLYRPGAGVVAFGSGESRWRRFWLG